MTAKKTKDLSKDEDFLHAAFRGYDKNKDGKISLEEFKRVMTRRSDAEKFKKWDRGSYSCIAALCPRGK